MISLYTVLALKCAGKEKHEKENLNLIQKFNSFLNERSLKLEYLQDNMIDGVETYDFHLAKDSFYNSTLNPENEGYCSGYDCLGNGVFNLSRCLGGISMFGSSPHFLNAEEKFVQAVNGLNPNEQEHDYRLSMHPVIYIFIILI